MSRDFHRTALAQAPLHPFPHALLIGPPASSLRISGAKETAMPKETHVHVAPAAMTVEDAIILINRTTLLERLSYQKSAAADATTFATLAKRDLTAAAHAPRLLKTSCAPIHNGFVRPANSVGLVAAAMLALLIGAFSAPSAQAGTLDFEVGVGVNITELLSGNPKFGAPECTRSLAPLAQPMPQCQAGGFDGPRDTIEFALIWRSDDRRWFCKLSHLSHLSAGWPFNDEPEDFVERLECGRNWRLLGGF
jgi:hypothetical protein